MSKSTDIGWTDSTWNPWKACNKVSTECTHCYIDGVLRRAGIEPFGGPIRTAVSTWKHPFTWNRAAYRAGESRRVFTCSISDFFHPGADDWRSEAWEVIRDCQGLDWLVLTKRPELIPERLPPDWGAGYSNVWLGVTVGAERSMPRIPLLKAIPAQIRFISAEPLLGRLNFRPHLHAGIHWVITGCEQERKGRRRLMDVDWVRDIDEQCRDTGVAHFFKQYYRGDAGVPIHDGILDGVKRQAWPLARRALPTSKEAIGSVSISISQRGKTHMSKQKAPAKKESAQEQAKSWAEVNELHAKCLAIETALSAEARTHTQHALRLGELLCTLKAGTPHGQWEAAVAKNCRFGIREGQRYMRLFEKQHLLEVLDENWQQRTTITQALDLLHVYFTGPMADATEDSQAKAPSAGRTTQKTTGRSTGSKPIAPKFSMRNFSVPRAIKACVKIVGQVHKVVDKLRDAKKLIEAKERAEALRDELNAVIENCDDLISKVPPPKESKPRNAAAKANPIAATQARKAKSTGKSTPPAKSVRVTPAPAKSAPNAGVVIKARAGKKSSDPLFKGTHA